ncbi:MAG TPA: MFS transporter [Actinoplanes sp.]|jgi:MFS family permease|nr:MFS transporter [Actinoplanes sp.]
MIETQARATYRQVFAVREFRTVLANFAVFLVGENVQMLALSVLVYASTGSALLAALAYVAGFLPQALGGTVLLAVADRWRPRRLLLGFDALRLVVAVLLASGTLPSIAMVLLVFALGGVAPVVHATRTALLPDLLDGDAYVLGRSLFTVVSGAMQVVGAAVGGLLLALTGPAGALWLAAAACALSAVVVRFGLADRPARAAGGRGAVGETWRVNRALLADPRIRGLLLAQWLPGALMVAAEGAVVPYAAGLGRESAAGLILATAAGGMLTGEFLVARLIPPATRERLTPWLALVLGIPLTIFLIRPGVVLAAITMALAAAGFSYQLGLARRFLEAVPEARRGQAFGLAGTGLMTLQGLAMAAAGGLADVLTPGAVMALAGIASLTATLTLWRTLRP